MAPAISFMVRLLVVLLLCVVAGALLAGCGGGGDDPDVLTPRVDCRVEVCR